MILQRRCDRCGQPFTRKTWAARVAKGYDRFCSVRCSATREGRRGSLRDRWLARVAQTDGCWLWRGTTSGRGYGVLYAQGRQVYAHRLAYEFFVGPIPPGLFVLHGCDTPACVNPAHLRLGTHDDNMRDAVVRDRFCHGAAHPASRLTERAVAEIRVRLSAGEKFIALARAFSVSEATIRHIATGSAWRGHRAQTTGRVTL